MIRLEVHGTESLRAGQERLRRVQHSFNDADRVIARKAALEMRRALRAEAPVKTGRLRRSIDYRIRRSPGGGWYVRFRAESYARFVIKGTRPHIEQAGIYSGRDSGHALWPAHPVAAIHHPGTHANDFRRRAWERSGSEVRGILRETGRGVLHGHTWGAGPEEI